MKKIRYTTILLLATALCASCEVNEITYDATPLTDEAEFQIHYMEPITPSLSTTYMYRVEVNDVMVTNNTTPLASYNSQPSGAVGLYFTAKPGKVNIKLYQSVDLNLVYDWDVNLVTGKQNVVIHDLNKEPIVYDTQFPFVNDRKSYDTDTISYVKFYNLLYEEPGRPTHLKLQYVYQYTLHPLYTLYDQQQGTIPEGKKVGDATKDATKSEWLNLGSPVAFGETTGWQPVPVKKATYSGYSQARVDYRIMVVEGGTVGVDMNDEGRLLAQTTSGKKPVAYSDYWTAYSNRRVHHFYSGTRNGKPGSAVRILTAR